MVGCGTTPRELQQEAGPAQHEWKAGESPPVSGNCLGCNLLSPSPETVTAWPWLEDNEFLEEVLWQRVGPCERLQQETEAGVLCSFPGQKWERRGGGGKNTPDPELATECC